MGQGDGRGPVRFGIFERDTSAGVLRKNGDLVRLQDQPLRVLLHLVNRPGELVTREELRRALWTENTFVDFDRGLNTAVNKVREALGDLADSPRFVQTIPRKGYRFIAAIDPGPSPSVARGVARHWLWLSVALALLAVVGLSLTISGIGRDVSNPVITPLTSLPRVERSPTFSPDGKMVAFTWTGREGEINSDIYVKQIGAESQQRLTNDEALNHSPAWSPDGQWIAFLQRIVRERHAIYLIPAMGGEKRKLGEIRIDDTTRTLGRQLAWSADSEWVIFPSTQESGESLTRPLFALSIRTGRRVRLTTPPPHSLGDSTPAVSPDGANLVFLRSREMVAGELYLARLANNIQPVGEPRPLTSESSDGKILGGPAWLPNSREIVFTMGTIHLRRLWQLDVMTPAKPIAFPHSGTYTGQPAVARTGWRMALGQDGGGGRIDVWQLKLTPRKVEARMPFNSTYVDHMPRYSPDGTKIAFVSNRSGSQQIWIAGADGSNPEQLTFLAPGEEALSGSWSSTGRFVYHVQGIHGARTLLLEPDGGVPKEIRIPGQDRAHNPWWSRDGRWLYFSFPAFRPDMWKIRIGEQGSIGDPVFVKKNATRGCESVDGRFLFYVKDDGQLSLQKAPVHGGSDTLVVKALSRDANFEVVDDGVYFIPLWGPDARTKIQFLSFATGKTETLGNVDRPVMWGFAISPDRKSILYVQGEYATGDLILLDNFR